MSYEDVMNRRRAPAIPTPKAPPPATYESLQREPSVSRTGTPRQMPQGQRATLPSVEMPSGTGRATPPTPRREFETMMREPNIPRTGTPRQMPQGQRLSMDDAMAGGRAATEQMRSLAPAAYALLGEGMRRQAQDVQNAGRAVAGLFREGSYDPNQSSFGNDYDPSIYGQPDDTATSGGPTWGAIGRAPTRAVKAVTNAVREFGDYSSDREAYKAKQAQYNFPQAGALRDAANRGEYGPNQPAPLTDTYTGGPERQSWVKSLGNGQTASAAANFRANSAAFDGAQDGGGFAPTPAIGGSGNPQLDMYNRMIQQNREDGDVGAKVGMIGGGLDAEMAARKAYIDKTSLMRPGGRAGRAERALDLKEQGLADAMQRAVMGEQGQMERLQFGEQGALRRAQLGESGAMRRAEMGESGAMRRAEMGERGAMARARMGEEGALTRAEMQRMSEAERLAAEGPYRQAQTGLVGAQTQAASMANQRAQIVADAEAGLNSPDEDVRKQSAAVLRVYRPRDTSMPVTTAAVKAPLGALGQFDEQTRNLVNARMLRELQGLDEFAMGGMVYGDEAIPGFAMGGGVRPLQYTNPTTDYLEKYYAAGLDKVLGPPSQGALAKVGMMQGAMQNPQTMGMGAMGFAQGGAIPVQGKLIEGPGTGTSDSVPAVIDGKYPAKLSNGEFVWTAAAANAYKGAADDLKAIMQAAEQRDPTVITALHKLAKVAMQNTAPSDEGMMPGMQEMED